MFKCVVTNCKNTSEDSFRFFSFPKDSQKALIWKTTLHLPVLKINKGSKICEAHFPGDNFVLKEDVFLKDNALPTIYKPDEFRNKTSIYCNLLQDYQDTKNVNIELKNKLELQEVEIEDLRNKILCLQKALDARNTENRNLQRKIYEKTKNYEIVLEKVEIKEEPDEDVLKMY